MTNIRLEMDNMGSISVPQDRYWGAQTQRALQNFCIGDEQMPKALIRALGIQKKVAALANMQLGVLDKRRGDAIVQAAEEVAIGRLEEHFPLAVWQTGSGTQTNMNANEVIANRAIEILGGVMGSKDPIHPNDHVNFGQSSNDSFPTAMSIAAVQAIHQKLLPSLKHLHQSLALQSEAFDKILKTGRTHLQDATPITLGQEFSGYTRQIELGITRLQDCLPRLMEIAQGGTSVGTGLNAPQGFAALFATILANITGLPFTSAVNRFEAQAAHDAVVEVSGVLNVIAVSCMKIANDVRLLASGPRCGLGELFLPVNEPGSSIMPGKVNPTQCEALTQVCAQVMGNHTTISIAGAGGHLELNAFKPVMINNLLQSIGLIADSTISFSKYCVSGIKPNPVQIQRQLEKSLMLITALTPHIGYDKAAMIVQIADEKNISLIEAAIESDFVTKEQFYTWIRPENMVGS